MQSTGAKKGRAEVRNLPALFGAAGLLALACTSARAGGVVNQSPDQIDGWTISWQTSNVSLTIVQDPIHTSQVDIIKMAVFQAPNQGFQITFVPTPGQSQTANLFDFSNESITNDTGKSFGDFSFILLNSGTAQATITNEFLPPSGAGYSYSGPTISNGNQEADYPGNQNDGVTSLWGGTTTSDYLSISAPAGSIFSLKELSEQGTSVPEPAAVGLLGGGLVLLRQRRKRA